MQLCFYLRAYASYRWDQIWKMDMSAALSCQIGYTTNLTLEHPSLQVYWLDIDYLKVAEAALHCSASMTALLYVEEWYKEVHGRLIMGSDNHLNEVQLQYIGTLAGYRAARISDVLVFRHQAFSAFPYHAMTPKPCHLEHSQKALPGQKPVLGLLDMQDSFKFVWSCNEASQNVSQGLDDKAEKLLVDIYSQVREPDSIYAVVRSHHEASLLPLLEHEEAWSRVLVAHDLSQQVQEGLGNQSGIVSTLKRLGCRSAVQVYLRGVAQAKVGIGGSQSIHHSSMTAHHLAAGRAFTTSLSIVKGRSEIYLNPSWPSGTDHGSWMKEAECEMLWQMGQWQDALEASGQSDSDTGFHATICSCLKVRQETLAQFNQSHPLS